MTSWWKEAPCDDDILSGDTPVGIVPGCRASRSQRTALSFRRVSVSVSEDGARILRPRSPASSEPNVPADLAVAAEGTELHRGLPKRSPCVRSFEIHGLGCAEHPAPGSQAHGGTAGVALAPRVPLCEEGPWKHTHRFLTAKPLPCTQTVHHGAPGERDRSAEGGGEVVLCRGVLVPGHSPGLKPPPAAPRHSPWPRGPVACSLIHLLILGCLSQDALLPCSAFSSAASDPWLGSILLTRSLNVPSRVCILGHCKCGLRALVSLA